LRVVAIDHGGAARLEAEENFRLGVGDRLDRPEIFQMRGLDGRMIREGQDTVADGLAASMPLACGE
jgi:hypothetical protein